MKTSALSTSDYYLDKLEPLVGGRITGLVRTGTSENNWSDEFFGFTVVTAKGKNHTLWFLRDDEGNGPGSFELTKEN